MLRTFVAAVALFVVTATASSPMATSALAQTQAGLTPDEVAMIVGTLARNR
jgi:hypothetical protein